jgi:peptide/nickel transport system substrate-binding protein
VFKERQKGDHITLAANPNYWRGKPKFDQWIFKVVPDANVLAVQLKTGEVDMRSFSRTRCRICSRPMWTSN